MSKNNNNTPRLRFPDFTGEWEEKKLGESVGSFKTGKLDANAMVEGGEYRFYTCAKDFSFIDSYAFEGDCIMIAGNGAHLGYVHHYNGKFNAYQRTYVLSDFNCDSNYLECCIRRFLPDRIRQEKKEGNMPYIVLSTLTDMLLYFPPSPEEQKKIADCLFEMDNLISAQAQKVEALKDQKKGMMQQLFPQKGETTPRLRFPGFTGEWEEKKLGESVGSFKTGKLDANAMVEGGEYRFYTCAKDFSFIDSYAFEGDCIMIAGNGAHLGYVHHYNGKFNAYQRTYVLSDFNCDSNYLECCIRRFLPDRIRQEKKEGNMPYIVLSTLTDMLLYFPPSPEEQKKIADCLSELDTLIAAETAQLESLKDHKKGLMQQLFPQPAK